jgi:ABC-2 type transport system permease protein
MGKIWAVAKREMLELYHNPGAIIWTLAVPIILIAFIGQVFKFDTTDSSTLKVSVGIVQQDQSAAGKGFADGLSQISIFSIETMDLDTAKDRVNNKRNLSAYIIIPANFGEALQSGQGAKFTGVIDPSDSTRQQIIKGTLQSYADHYNNFALIQTVAAEQARKGGSTAILSPQELVALQNSQKPSVTLSTENAGVKSINSFDQIAPGYATMFVIFGLNTVAITIIEERKRGTLRRLAVMPMPGWAFMGGKMLAQFFVSFAQVAIMLGVARLFFNVNINLNNLPGILLLVVSLSFAATGLGMLIASIFRTEGQVGPVVTLVALIGSALGGSWFPLFLMPDWVQSVSKVTINSWAMQGFNDLMLFNAQVGQVLLNFVVLMAYGLICLFLALRFFKYRAL